MDLDMRKQLSLIIKVFSKDVDEILGALNSVFESSSEVFEMISSYQKEFVKNEMKHIEFYYTTLDNLTGCYMYLSPIVQVIEPLISKKSLQFYHLKKMKSLNDNEKFVSAPVERESDLQVVDLKLVFSLFVGYIDSCRQGIQTCRRRITNNEEEQDLVK